jgi:broad specificity phosphatase PhoE
MSTLYLIRHGDITRDPADHRFIGRLDIPLSSLGRQQMEKLAAHPRLQSIGQVLSSPLCRCRESADILSAAIACGPAQITADLAEIDLGLWEGLSKSEVETRFPGQYAARGADLAGFRPEGGESFADLQQRCWPVLEQAAGCTIEHVALVTHAGVNRVLLCRILGMPLARMFSLVQDYGCCNILHFRGKDAFVQGMNLCYHNLSFA